MLKKLMKYDLKSLFKTMIPLYVVLLSMSVLNRIMYFVSEKFTLLKLPAGLITTIYVIMLIGVPMASFIIGIVKYYNNLVKDEGYLMHTLPVKKSSLILSKLYSSMIVLMSSVCVSFIAFVIGCIGVYFKTNLFSEIYGVLKHVDLMIVVLFMAAMIVGVVFQQVMIYLSISLGQKHNSNKVVYSFVYGIVVYNATQIVTSIALIIPMLFNKDIFKYLNDDLPPLNILRGFMIASVVISLVFTVLYYYFTKKTMETKLNLE